MINLLVNIVAALMVGAAVWLADWYVLESLVLAFFSGVLVTLSALYKHVGNTWGGNDGGV
jgi:fluoride ion exporter CrcB/FEX|tara:strand:+ start:6586 stop:6765 length:180 start_codon:yes stop_codon:yes gene_type:complete